MTRLLDLAALIINGFLSIAMVALLVMMLTIVCDVFMRYVFNTPITGAYDIVEISLIIVVFYSLGAIIISLQEILIDLIDHLVSPRTVVFLQRFSALLSTAILIFIFVSMMTPAIQSYQYGEMRLELNMPTWIMWAIALVGMANGVLASLVKLITPGVMRTIRDDPPEGTLQ